MVDVTAWDVAIEVLEGVGLPGFVVSFYFDADEVFWRTGSIRRRT